MSNTHENVNSVLVLLLLFHLVDLDNFDSGVFITF